MFGKVSTLTHRGLEQCLTDGNRIVKKIQIDLKLATVLTKHFLFLESFGAIKEPFVLIQPR